MSIYIIFKDDNIPTRKLSFIKKIFVRILFFFLPKANPDFESKIDLVRTWCLEFNDIESIPIREVGLDSENRVILKMPYKKNYGYWTDNVLKYNDFERLFKIKKISKEFFIERWENFN